MSGRIRFGTSGWSERRWIGPFYPEGTRPLDFLAYYARQFDTVECDTSHSRPLSRSMVRGWEGRTPEGFKLAAKFPRSVVHGSDSERPNAARLLVREHVQHDTDAFLEAMAELGSKAGPLVLSFPHFPLKTFATLGAFLDRLDPFLAGLDPRFRYAVELRNKSWLAPELLHVLRRHRVALALVDVSGMPHPDELELDLVTTDFGYVRLIGERDEHDTRPPARTGRVALDVDQRLERWARLLRMLKERMGLIYAVANDAFAGHAPATVRELAARVARRD